MLQANPPIAFIATVMPDRSRAFYAETLGLRLLADDQFSLVFDLAGVPLRVPKVRELQPQPFTVLGWTVDDVAAELAELRSRGVAFERFPGMGQDDDGIWRAPGGARIAWFKDPDGNVLSIAQA